MNTSVLMNSPVAHLLQADGRVAPESGNRLLNSILIFADGCTTKAVNTLETLRDVATEREPAGGPFSEDLDKADRVLAQIICAEDWIERGEDEVFPKAGDGSPHKCMEDDFSGVCPQCSAFG